MSKQGLIIRTNNTTEWVDIPTNLDESCKLLNDVVRSPEGDYDLYERVQFYSLNNMSMWVNEFGTNPAFKCQPNTIAGLMNRDIIMGNAILTCETPEGEICGLYDKALEFAKELDTLVKSITNEFLSESVMQVIIKHKCRPFA